MLLRISGADLTPEGAVIRTTRRRTIPWNQVQAVRPHKWLGSKYIALVLENGERVRLPAPIASIMGGKVQYEQDFRRIGQWWLNYRGADWRPAHPEAPRNLP